MRPAGEGGEERAVVYGELSAEVIGFTRFFGVRLIERVAGRRIAEVAGRVALWRLAAQASSYPFLWPMYLCYLDASGDSGERGTEYLVLSGAALFEGVWAHLQGDITNLLATAPARKGMPARELHAVDIRGRTNAFRGLTKEQSERLLRGFCAITKRYLPNELRFISAFAHKPTWFAAHRGRSGDDLYAELFEQLASRFDLFLKRQFARGYPSKGMFIADEDRSELKLALRRHLKGFQSEGTRWAPTYNLIEALHFLDSDESAGIQLADLSAYAVYRLISCGDESLARQLSEVFDREPLTADTNAGKWHGLKSITNHPPSITRMQIVWR